MCRAFRTFWRCAYGCRSALNDGFADANRHLAMSAIGRNLPSAVKIECCLWVFTRLSNLQEADQALIQGHTVLFIADRPAGAPLRDCGH